MAIQFIDGWDAQDTIHKYEWVPNFLQDRVIDGVVPYYQKNGGYAWRAENTAFSSFVLTRTLTINSGFFVGFNFKLTAYQADFLLRFESGPLVYPGHSATQPRLDNAFVQLAVKVESDGRLSFWNGGSGTTNTPGARLGYSSASLPLNTWMYLEVGAMFGAGGKVECRFDGVSVYTSGTVTVQNATEPGLPSAVTLYFPPSFSVNRSYDNLYIADAAPDPWGNQQDFLGPCQVTTHWPIEDATVPEWTRNGGSSDYSRVADINHSTGYMGSPDGDTTYIDGASGQTDMFEVKQTDSFGKVLAVALNAYGRDKVVGSGSTIQFMARNRTNQTISNQQSWIVSYAPNPWYVVQSVSQDSLVDPSDVWNDSQINGCAWGLQAPGATARVSQFYIEKLVSLSGAPYTSGGANSYAF